MDFVAKEDEGRDSGDPEILFQKCGDESVDQGPCLDFSKEALGFWQPPSGSRSEC